MLFISPLTQLYSIIGWPQSFYGWVANLSMFGMAGPESALRPVINFIPNAWSLSVELFCYMLLSFYFAKTRRRAVALLIIGIAITGAELVRATVQALPQYDFQNHYGVLQAGIIPFAAGSLAYFCRTSPLLRFSRSGLVVLLLLWVVNWALTLAFEFHTYVSGLYAAVVINFFLVAMMFDYDAAHARPRAVKVLGSIAYAVFVSHILIGTLVVGYLPFARGVLLLPVTLVATIGFSLALHVVVERRIESLRVLIKRRRGRRFCCARGARARCRAPCRRAEGIRSATRQTRGENNLMLVSTAFCRRRGPPAGGAGHAGRSGRMPRPCAPLRRVGHERKDTAASQDADGPVAVMDPAGGAARNNGGAAPPLRPGIRPPR